MEWILETERLGFRSLEEEDQPALKAILGDPEVMYAWEHGFSEEEIRQWIKENQRRYKVDGYGYFAAIEKETEQVVGLMGLLSEHAEQKSQLGVGYILKKSHWGRGLAVEGAAGWISYAFERLNAPKVTAQIRPSNIASQQVARRLGMKEGEAFIKRYRGKDMVHILYVLEKPDFYQR